MWIHLELSASRPLPCTWHAINSRPTQRAGALLYCTPALHTCAELRTNTKYMNMCSYVFSEVIRTIKVYSYALYGRENNFIRIPRVRL